MSDSAAAEDPINRSCVPPPTTSATTTVYDITTTPPGHMAVVIDMGFSILKDPDAVHLHELNWQDVYERQQNWQASMILVIGAPEKQLEQREKYFNGWNSTTVNAGVACNLHCAWDPAIWNPPGQSTPIHLAHGRYAMSIQMQYKSGAPPPIGRETFHLILTKLFSGTKASDWHLTESAAEDCWRELIQIVSNSRRWVITGDLATWQHSCPDDMMLNRFAYHHEHEARNLDVAALINEGRTLAAVKCDMKLTIVRESWTSQSMVIQFPATQETIKGAWPFKPKMLTRGSMQPPATGNESSRGSAQSITRISVDTSCVQSPAWLDAITNHRQRWHNTVLIDMGFAAVKDPSAVPLDELTWQEVYEAQQGSQASLLIVLGAPRQSDRLEKHFLGWKFTTVNAAACNLHYAWDPTIWNQTDQCRRIHLADDRYAMAIQLECTSGATPPTARETFQLISTKLFSGTEESEWKLTSAVTEDCWHKLTQIVNSSQRWIIAGDLATWQHKCRDDAILDRFTNHHSDEVRKLDVDAITNTAETLTVVTCNMVLDVARSYQEVSQSMIIRIHETQERGTVNPHEFRWTAHKTMPNKPTCSGVQPPAPENESPRGSGETPASDKLPCPPKPLTTLCECHIRGIRCNTGIANDIWPPRCVNCPIHGGCRCPCDSCQRGSRNEVSPAPDNEPARGNVEPSASKKIRTGQRDTTCF